MKFSIFVFLMLLAATNAFPANNTVGSGPEVGQPAPVLNGHTLDDVSYQLENDTGQKKIINFFWVECHPCREEMPELARLEKQYKNIKFISVHTTLNSHTEEPENVAKFVKSLKGAPSNIVLTTSSEIGTDFNIDGLPHTLILDEDNVVLRNIPGYNTKTLKEIQTALKRMSK